MKSFQYYAGYSISYLLPFLYKDYINMHDFFNYVKLCGSYMHKVQERANVKTHYGFGNDPMKMCFKHKTRLMKVDHKIKDIKIVLNCVFIM